MLNKTSKCNLCLQNTSKRSNKAIEGIRTVLTLAVMIHHIDILNPKLLEENVLWSDQKRNLLNNDESNHSINIWHLMPDKSLSPLGLFINVFNGYLSVTIFLIFSGYILSFQFFNVYKESKSYQKCSYNLIKLSIKRSSRFISPLFTIQLLTWLMYYYDFIIPEQDANPYALPLYYYLRFDMLFFWKTNGALWIMKCLFYAPFLVIPVLFSIIGMRSFQSRFYIYLLYSVCLYQSDHFSILLGVVMADLLHFTDRKSSKLIQIYIKYKFVIPTVSFCFLFIKILFFKEIDMIVDFNKSKTFRPLIWWNILVIVFLFPVKQNLIYTIFSNHYLSSCGKYTFSVYITHIPIYRLIAQNIVAKYHLFQVIDSPYNIIIYPIAMIFTVAISILFHHLIDNQSRNYIVEPFIKWYEKVTLLTSKQPEIRHEN